LSNAKQEIAEITKEVFTQTFGDAVEFNQSLAKDNVESWDSLKHVLFFVNLEKAFNLKFDQEEVMKLSTMSEILEYINQAKTANP